MSKEMREQIDRVKNFDQFLNEKLQLGSILMRWVRNYLKSYQNKLNLY